MELNYLIGRVWHEQPYRFSVSVISMAIAGLLEAVALAAVLPLLQIVQGGTSLAASGRMGFIVSVFLQIFHLPFNLTTSLVFVLLLFFASQLVILAQAKLLAGSVARFEAKLRMNLYEAITEASWPFFVEHKSSDLTTGLMHHAVYAGQAYKMLVNTLGTVLMIVVYLALALWFSVPMTLIVGISGGIILLLLQHRVRLGTLYGKENTAMAFDMWSEAGEHINAAKTVKAYSVEGQTIGRFDAMTERFTHIQYKDQMNQGWLKFFYDTGSMTAIYVAIYVAVTYFGTPIAFLVVFLLVFYRISPRISALQSLQTQVLVLVPALRVVDDMTRDARAAKEASGTLPAPCLEREVSLDHVSFAYHEDAQVLRDVSFLIPKGSTVAIVGPSGSGKTTIVDLLLAVIAPTSGSVKIDGTPLTEFDMVSWRNQIGYVAQDSSFFHDTVRQNIAFGCPGATDEQVEAAAKLAYADGFIADLPEGYETIIGDRGVRLSGGQRQRLALARAIVRSPEILILDEATSALDAESEGKIQQAVDQLAKHMTVVIVTHRFSTVRNADVIHFLEHGVLVESGSWDELVERAGRFAEMQDKQSLA
jgi:ATP-binding cassette subfamily C protein